MAAPSGFERFIKFMDAGVYLVFLFFVLQRERVDLWNIVFTALSLAGFFLWMLARHQLGESFRVRAEAHKLVTHGLYSRIRNPIYFFAAVAFGAAFLALRLYLWLGVMLVVQALMQGPRVLREQKVLEEAFGDEYRAYKARTWF